MFKIKVIRSIKDDDLFMNYDEKVCGMPIPTFHYHNVYEVYIIKKGKRNIIINNLVYETSEGDAAMIKPNEFHRSYGDTPYSGICLNFSENYLDKHFTPLSKVQIISCFKKPIISLDNNALTKIYGLAENIISHPKKKFIYLAYILDILNDSSKKADEKYKLVINSNLSPISNYISDNFMDITSLEDIAKALCITKNHLCHLFKKQTGMTVFSYINSLRIQQACVFLFDSSDSIVNISKKCGFDSPTYFNRVFKKCMGCTPSEFRMKINSSN